MAIEKISETLSVKGQMTGREEKAKKNGGTYYKLTVGNRSYNVFDSKVIDVIKGLDLNEDVEISYTETDGDFNGTPVKYKNVIGVKPLSEKVVVEEERVVDNSEPKKEVQKAPVNQPSPQEHSSDWWKQKFYDRKDSSTEQHLGKCENNAIALIQTLVDKDIVEIKSLESEEDMKDILALYKNMTLAIFKKDKEIREALKDEFKSS